MDNDENSYFQRLDRVRIVFSDVWHHQSQPAGEIRNALGWLWKLNNYQKSRQFGQQIRSERHFKLLLFFCLFRNEHNFRKVSKQSCVETPRFGMRSHLVCAGLKDHREWIPIFENLNGCSCATLVCDLNIIKMCSNTTDYSFWIIFRSGSISFGLWIYDRGGEEKRLQTVVLG